jgi:hypothetical protein
MGLRFTDAQQPNFPNLSEFRGQPPRYIDDQDAWFHSLPRYFYEVDVEYDPRARVAPAPTSVSMWNIGLVQNVLYERIEIEYLDQEPFTVTWARPALDIGSEAYRPFYNEPDVLEVSIPYSVAGFDRLLISREAVVPVHSLFYGPNGLGQLLDPWDPAGYAPMQNQSVRLRMIDQPFLMLRNWKGTELVRVLQVLALRFWIVAMPSGGRGVVLGLSPPFTLVAWMRLVPRVLQTIQPNPEHAWYSHQGVHRRVMTTLQQVQRYRAAQARGGGQRLAPQPASSPLPLLTGLSANDRAERWLRDNSLLPLPRSGTT